MSENKEAAPMLQHRDGEGKQTALPGVRLSASDSITARLGAQGVSELLLRGIENARPAAELVQPLGLRDSRELRRRVEIERRQGALILSLPTVGYWLPSEGAKGKREARLFARSMAARARNTERSAAAASAWAEAKHGEE